MNLFSSHILARFISTLFVPPSFTIIIFSIFAFTLESEPIKQVVTILNALVFGFMAPIVLFLILRKKGKLADQDASIKEERTIPFLIAIIFYLIGLWVLIKYDLNIISIAFWFCYISNTIITIFINKFWKISAHSMGVAGPFSAIVFAFGSVGIILLPIVILVGWARVELKCHTLTQVVAGILLASFSVYIQMSLIVKYFSN